MDGLEDSVKVEKIELISRMIIKGNFKNQKDMQVAILIIHDIATASKNGGFTYKTKLEGVKS